MGWRRCCIIFFVLIYVSFKAGSVLLAHRQVIIQALTYALFGGPLMMQLLFFQALPMILLLGAL